MLETPPAFTYAISTMGCKANLTDSQALEVRLRRLGGVAAEESGDAADLLLLNTCTVTDQADKEARAIVRKSGARLTVATGCLAEVDPEQISAVAPAAGDLRVLRNSAKEGLEGLVQEWLAGALREQRVTNGDRVGWHERILPKREAHESVAAAGRTRAFFKVQDGCNAFCAYCVIPLARGRSRSVPALEVVQGVNALVKEGVREVVLTAIHAADYDSEGLDFTGLVEKVLAETSVPRLRLTSLDPAEIPDRLLGLMVGDGRLCPHFHVSLQSANSRVLEGMKRAYRHEQVEERLLAIQRRLPHAYVGMDVIAGFPGETDADFADGLDRLSRLPFTKAHVFPFSVRRNTAAARLVAGGLAVPAAVVAARAKALRDLSARKMAAALAAKVGSVQEILVEAKPVELGGRRCSQGHSRNFHKVLVPGLHEANQLRRVRIVGVVPEKESLKGELV